MLLILSVVFLGSFAQEIPPIVQHKPDIAFAGNQNWMISQDEDGTLYTANNKGLLHFRGTAWELNTSPNQSIIRSVKVIDDKICMGSYMDFGYWEKAINGVLTYTSLAEELNIQPIEDEQFWNIIDQGEKIIFQSLNRLVISDIGEKTTQFVTTENTLLKSFKVANNIYFQEAGKGLFELRSGKPFLLSDDENLLDNVIVGLFKVEGKLLILTNQSGFYFLENNQLKKWNINEEENLRKYKLYSSLQLSDGSFMLGTISNGLLWIDGKGNKILELNKSKGISNNTILSLFEDKNQNLWLGLDNGIDCINLKSPFLEYNDREGKIGAVYASARVGNYFYLGTNHGLYYRELDRKDEFRQIEGTEGQVWNLTVFDEGLFCGHDLGTFFVEGKSAKKISEVSGAWNFKKHPKNDQLLLQGNYNGIHLLKKENNQWFYQNKLEGFDISSRFFEFVNDTTLLVGHEYKGVFRLVIDPKLEKVIEVIKDTSVEKGIHAGLTQFDREIFYFNPNGVFRYDKDRLSFSKESTLTGQIGPENYITGKMIDDHNGRLWLFSKDKIHFLRREIFSEKIKAESIFFETNNRKNVLGFEHVSKYDDSRFLIASAMGYLLIDLNKIKKTQPDIYFQKILVKDSLQNYSPVSMRDNITLDFDRNGLQFFYTASNFQKYEQVKYQYRLEGYDQFWSPWTTQANVTFSNLPSGSYSFLVRSMLGDQISSQIEQFEFVILPPWYRSRLMYVVYVVLFLMLLILTNKLYDIYYEGERKKLIRRNQRKLEMSELANRRKLVEIRNEQLQKDLESKNREVAIATMSTVKRNEFLNSIKKELSGVASYHPKIGDLISTINKNLKSNDDWDFFKKAFDHADKDFLKKLKETHPSLTHNDLRLCAYLRLNLVSKEIAPLLNISLRSVEIKRYRLRKKMNLEGGDGLVEYLMSF